MLSQIPAGEHSPPHQGSFSPVRLLLLPLILHILHPHRASIKVFFSPSPPRNHSFPFFCRLANPYLHLGSAAAISKVVKSNLQQTNPYLENFNNSNTVSQPMSRPVYLCEEHRRQRIKIEVQIWIMMQIVL